MTPQEQVAKFGEGLVFVRFGLAGDDDYELVGEVITKGKRPGAASGILVRPADGYAFVPRMFFDIKAYKLVPGAPNQFMVVKQHEPTDRALSLTMSTTDSFQDNVMDELAAAVRSIPGVVVTLQK